MVLWTPGRSQRSPGTYKTMDAQTNDQPMTEDDAKAAADRQDRLQVFGSTMAATRDRWIRARAATGWDKRIQQDLDQYHMRDAAHRMGASMMDAVQQGYPVTAREAKVQRSTVYVGITRQKTNAGEARFSDIMLPTDDRNWGIKPSPDAEGARAIEENGKLVDPATGQEVWADAEGNIVPAGTQGAQALTKKTIALAAQRMAAKSAEAMTQEIDDQLVECDYNSEQRKMIHDSAVMGTGVIKGPLVTKRIKKVWRERKEVDQATGQTRSIQVLEIVENTSPASFRVDPRNVWEDPACGDDVQNGAGVFELEKLTEKRVRELGKQPGYIRSQLLEVIKQGPQRNAALYELTRQEQEKDGSDEDKLYHHWIFWGELRREDLVAAGVDVGQADELDGFSGCVEMINDVVVRAYLNPLEGSEIPYDFFPWEKVQGSVRGYGLPYLMRAEQSVVNAAWRQLMDNSAITAGPQILVNRKAIKPVDNTWTVRAFKFWDITDDTIDPSRAFHVAEFNSHQQELIGVIELAEKLGDQSSSVPMLTTGEKGTAPDTVGGMQMLMNSANVVLRRLVKQYDDLVTKRHIRRYYDYNMAYSDKEEIKGDFQVDARGSSALIVRDIQSQAYTNLLAAAANPLYAPLIDRKKLFEKALQAQHVDPADIMNSDEVIEQNMQAAAQQSDPRIEAAKINAQAHVMSAKAVAEGKAAEIESRTQQEQEDRALRVRELEIKREVAILEVAAKQQISIDQVKAQLAQAAIQDRTKKELAASEMLFKQTASPDHKGI